MYEGMKEPEPMTWSCGDCGSLVPEAVAMLQGYMCDTGRCRQKLLPLFDRNGNQHSRFTNRPGMIPKEF